MLIEFECFAGGLMLVALRTGSRYIGYSGRILELQPTPAESVEKEPAGPALQVDLR